jgi:predicted O-methyltransferase YrrM
MRVARRILKSMVRPWLRRDARRQLSGMRDSGIPAAEKVADAIEDVLDNRFSVEERQWINRIETLRSQLADDSRDVLSMATPTDDPAAPRVLEQVAVGQIEPYTVADACTASKPYSWCLLLFKLVRKLQPQIALELGTCLGISAAYQSAAEQLNGRGRLITLEGSAGRAGLAKEHLKSLGLDNATVVTGIFEDTLENTLGQNSPVDFAFIDGHHDEQATLKYYEQLLPHLVEESVLIFDDISWSAGMCRAWRTLENHPKVVLSTNLGAVGVCIVSAGRGSLKHRLKLRMPT